MQNFENINSCPCEISTIYLIVLKYTKTILKICTVRGNGEMGVTAKGFEKESIVSFRYDFKNQNSKQLF